MIFSFGVSVCRNGVWLEEFSRKEGLMAERKTSIDDKISPNGFSLSEKRRIIAICNRYAKAIGSVQFCKSKNSSI